MAIAKKSNKLDKDINSEGKVEDKTGFYDLDSFKKEIKKEFGDNSALSDDDFVTSFISTGLDPLDYLLGGGFPQGAVSEICGLEGAGKSSLGIHMLGQVTNNGGLGVLIDTEGGAGDKFRFANFGVDTNKCLITVEDLAERCFSQIERVANYIQKKNVTAPSLLVLDSVAGLTTRAEMEATYESGSFGVTARMIKKGIQRTKMMCRETNLAVLFINQVRVKIGGNSFCGPEYSSPGGDTLKFQAITRLFLSRGKFIGEPKLPEGHIIRLKVIKCKTSSSLGRTLPVRFYYDNREYSNAHSIHDLLVDNKQFQTSGAWKIITMPDGSEKKFNSVETFANMFNENEANKQYFLDLMKTCFNKSLGYTSSSDTNGLVDSYGNLIVPVEGEDGSE